MDDDLYDRLRADLAQAVHSGEPEEWVLPIAKADLRQLLAKHRPSMGPCPKCGFTVIYESKYEIDDG